MVAGFIYPSTAPKRRHAPQGYAHAISYRAWLRDEFAFRCVYCLIREQWGRVGGYFDLDHFVTQSLDRSLSLEYHNLLYSCRACNPGKGAQLTPDPVTLLLDGSVEVDEEGGIQGMTRDAERLIQLLDLNDEEYRHWRRLWIRIIRLARENDAALYRELMGFPDDLPDLARLRPPGGNPKKAGISESWFARRQRNELPETY